MATARYIVAGVLALLLLVGCGAKGVKPLTPQDTPPNHYLQGMNLVDQGLAGEAMKRFTRAVELDPGYAPGYAGQALLVAAGAAGQPDAQHKALEAGKFRKLLNKAYGKADGPAEKFIVCATGIRAEAAAMDGKWLKAAESWHGRGRILSKVEESGLPYYRSKAALDYFMARAQFRAGAYEQARLLLARVAGSGAGRWHAPANALFARVQKIERAMANFTFSDTARVIAAKKTVSRADVAVLLVSEIKLDRLFGGRLSSGPAPQPEFVPADVSGHIFRTEVLDVVKWNVRGLEPVYDAGSKAYLFHPDRAVSRKAMAFALEDILIKASGDEGLATKFFGQDNSPYPDVKPSEPWYNAVVNCVSRNLMETDLSGAFRPDEPLDGADLLLAIVRLRNAVNVY